MKKVISYVFELIVWVSLVALYLYIIDTFPSINKWYIAVAYGAAIAVFNRWIGRKVFPIRDAELPYAPKSGGAQVDEQSQDENDRPKACIPKYHEWQFYNSHNTFCPDCGERLSS